MIDLSLKKIIRVCFMYFSLNSREVEYPDKTKTESIAQSSELLQLHTVLKSSNYQSIAKW